MLGVIILLLVVLWFFGYVRLDAFPVPDITLFTLNGNPVTIWNLLIFFVIVWAIGVLPSPLRQIAFVILVLWILSILGILAFAGLSSILIWALIIGVVAALLGFF